MTPTQLRAARERLGLTQEQLAHELGVRRLSVIRWEGGDQPISRLLELAMRAIDAELRMTARRARRRCG